MSKIKDLLIQNTLGISTYEPSMKNIIIRLDEAEQAILKLIDEAIGEDETDGDPKDPNISDAYFYVQQSRNRLRADIRKKLGIGDKQ